MWANIKHINIYMMVLPERREKNRKIFTKNFLNYYKNINLHIQNPLQTLSGINAGIHK